MTFEELLNQAIALLQRQGRVSYRALKRQFDLDDQYLEDLKTEIVDVLQLAVDEGGKVLVWTGRRTPSTPSAPEEPAGRRAESPTAGAPAAAESVPREAERRQLTVMFCDLVDSTNLAARLDPEDLREIVRDYQQVMAQVIQRFGGHVAQYLGDGVLVYFGYPVAHEDDGLRGVRSALEILTAMARLNTGFPARHHVRLAVRVGIHTGPVVVGEVGGGARHEHLALGETPNVAARLQGLAAPDSVVVSGATWRIVRGYFTSEDLGLHAVKGLAEPVAVHRILEESGAQTRLDFAAPGELTPLVGRESEMQLLLDRWARSKDGHGQAVLLSGEPGIGKSRLVDVLRHQVSSDGGLLIAFHCSPYHTNSALYPVIHHLERVLHFQRDETPETKLAKLERMLETYRFANERTVSLLAALLSVPVPEERYALRPSNPQLQKQQTLEALTGWLLEEAERGPVLTTFEDVHWADPSTIELVSLLFEHLPTERMLAVLTARAEFHPPWPPRSYLSHLTLNRLTRAQAEAMIGEAVHGERLPAEVVDQIVAKTDGIPLFIEELLKMILESGLLRAEATGYVLRGPLPALAIPTTLQDSLMARLDRLASARETAQLGAALGREFSYEMIHAVSSIDETALQQALGQLVEAELIYRRGWPPAASYSFKHALIRDAAYQSLLKSRRRVYHERIAHVLEDRFPETRETQPELLAHHYTEAGSTEQAIVYWQRAGQRAIERSANVEAIAYLTQALELLTLLPEGTERAAQELTLRIALGVPLIATRGYAAFEVERTYARARELSGQAGETPQLANILWGLWVFYLTGGPLETALQMAEQYRALAEHRQETPLLLETCQLQGIALFYLGEFVRARPHLERGSRLYDPEQHHALIFQHGGADTGVAIMTHEALALWALGYPDQAREKMHAGLQCARALGHPFSLAFAHYFYAWFHKLCREEGVVHQAATAAIGICDEYGFPFWGLSSTALRGSTIMEGGAEAEGIAAMQQALTAFEAMGAQLYRPELLGLLGAALGRTGRAEEGLSVLTKAFAAMEKSQERWWHPELHRLRGELLGVASGDHAGEAERAFHEALAVARRQQARSWELRAAMSLSRLWQRQAKATQARALLADVYGGFTEGFETADLREAHGLLADLER